MATKQLFDEIKKIDERTKIIVLGYIRLCQKLLSSKNNPYYNIPELINYLCIIYYHHSEYFTKHGQFIQLNQNNDTITRILKVSNTDNSVYGNILIDAAVNLNIIYSWTFKIIESSLMFIGIDSSNKKHIGGDFSFFNGDYFYAYGGGDGIGNHGWIYSQITLEEEYGDNLKINDELRMELNTKNSTMRYFINNIDQGIAFQDIDFDDNKKYYMAICLTSSSKVKLIDFNQTYIIE